MKPNTNVVRIGISMTMALGLLTACNGGFHSQKLYSDKELGAYLKSITPAAADASGVEDTWKNGPIGTTVETPAPKVTADGGKDPAEPGIVGAGAVSHVIAENPPERNDLVASNVQQLMDISAKAAEFVKGISIDLTPTTPGGSELTIAVRAEVVVTGIPMLLNAAASSLTYLKEGKVAMINVRLQKSETDDVGVQPVDNVILQAVCTDENCTEVQVRLLFKDTTDFWVAVFRMTRNGDTFAMAQSNLSKAPVYTTYEEALPSFRDLVLQAQVAAAAAASTKGNSALKTLSGPANGTKLAIYPAKSPAPVAPSATTSAAASAKTLSGPTNSTKLALVAGGKTQSSGATGAAPSVSSSLTPNQRNAIAASARATQLAIASAAAATTQLTTNQRNAIANSTRATEQARAKAAAAANRARGIGAQ